MWDFAWLFGTTAHPARRPYPGKWPDDATDSSFSDMSIVLDEGRTEDLWLVVACGKVSVVFRAVQYVWVSLLTWMGLGPCATCGTRSLLQQIQKCHTDILNPAAGLRQILAATVEQLHFVKQSYGYLQIANADLKADSTATRNMVEAVYHKLLGTANDVNAMEQEFAELGAALHQQGPQIITMLQRLNGLGAQIKALLQRKVQPQDQPPQTEIRHQRKRIDSRKVILQRQLIIANARNEDLLAKNKALALKLQLPNGEAAAKEELAKAKEDIEQCQHEIVCQQDIIRELRRLLKDSHGSAQEIKEEHEAEMERLRADYGNQLDAAERAYEKHLFQVTKEMKEKVNEFWGGKRKEWEEREETLVSEVKLQCALDVEDRVRREVMERLEEGKRTLDANTNRREKVWEQRIAILEEKNKVLALKLADATAHENDNEDRFQAAVQAEIKAFLRPLDAVFQEQENKWSKEVDRLKRAKKSLARRLARVFAFVPGLEAHFEASRITGQGFENGAECPPPVGEPQEIVTADAKAEPAKTRASHRRQTMDAPAKDRQRSSERLDASRVPRKARTERAEPQQLTGHQEDSGYVAVELDAGKLKGKPRVLRPDHDDVAPNCPANEADTKHPPDLQALQAMMAALEASLSKIDVAVEVTKVLVDEAGNLQDLDIEAEIVKDQGTVSVAKRAQYCSPLTSPIRTGEVMEEQLGEVKAVAERVSNVMNPYRQQSLRLVNPQLSVQKLSASVPASRPTNVKQRKSLSSMPRPIQATSPFRATTSANACQSEGRLPLQTSDRRLNRVRYVAAPTRPLGQDAVSLKRRRDNMDTPCPPSWSGNDSGRLQRAQQDSSRV